MASPGDPPRRVLAFTAVFPSSVDPHLGVFVKERLRWLARLPGYSVRVISPVPWFPPLRAFPRWHRYSLIPRREWVEELEVLRPRYPLLPKLSDRFHGRSMHLGSRREAARLRASFPFDIIDAHFVYPDGYAAVLLGRELGVPVVVTARGSDIREKGRDLRVRDRVAWTLREADALVAVSEDLAGRMKELGAPAVRVVQNGVDGGRFHPLEPVRARRELGLPASGPVLVTVGHRIRQKGHLLLLEAVALLRARWPSIRLHIIGGPARGRPDLGPELRRRIAEGGLSGNVELHDPVDQETLNRWYNAADLFCLLSESEGCPNVLLEALACGVPAVATRVGGIPEVLSSSRLGVMVDRLDPVAAAEAIHEALSRSWDRLAIRQELQGRTWSAAAVEMRRTYEEVLASRAAAGAGPSADYSPTRRRLRGCSGGTWSAGASS